jgi:hypothetical protein
MAATVFVSSAKGAADNTTTLATDAFTVGGSNRVLYVLAGSGAGTPVDPSAVKWGGSGGTSLTQLGSTLNMGSNAKASLWRLIAPATGSNTVHVTWGSAQDERWIIAVQVQDTDQTTPNNTVATATGTNASPTVNATSVSGNLVLDFVSFLDIGGAGYGLTDDVPDVLQSLTGAGGISAFEGAGASRETAAGTSTTCSWTVGGTLAGGGWSLFALAVNDAAAAPPDDPRNNYDNGVPAGYLVDIGFAALYGHEQQGIPLANRDSIASAAMSVAGASTTTMTGAATGAGALSADGVSTVAFTSSTGTLVSAAASITSTATVSMSGASVSAGALDAHAVADAAWASGGGTIVSAAASITSSASASMAGASTSAGAVSIAAVSAPSMVGAASVAASLGIESEIVVDWSSEASAQQSRAEGPRPRRDIDTDLLLDLAQSILPLLSQLGA